MRRVLKALAVIVGLAPFAFALGLAVLQVQELLEAAHQMRPYSKATRNNIPVELAVEG